jgi:hypothetical protein
MTSNSRLKQEAYDQLNFSIRVELAEKRIALSWRSNLLGEKYIVNAGNTGSLFGDPIQTSGVPRMFGTKIGWKFKLY